MPRVDIKKKEYKILDLKGWVVKQMKLNGVRQDEVAEVLEISQERVSQMLKIPDPKKRSRKKKGGKMEIDVFSYGQLLTLCEFFGVDVEERKKLLIL